MDQGKDPAYIYLTHTKLRHPVKILYYQVCFLEKDYIRAKCFRNCKSLMFYETILMLRGGI